jgi:hypothetical protein
VQTGIAIRQPIVRSRGYHPNTIELSAMSRLEDGTRKETRPRRRSQDAAGRAFAVDDHAGHEIADGTEGTQITHDKVAGAAADDTTGATARRPGSQGQAAPQIGATKLTNLPSPVSAWNGNAAFTTRSRSPQGRFSGTA